MDSRNTPVDPAISATDTDGAVAETSAPSVLEAAVDLWFVKHFHGLGPMLDERLYNLIQAAKTDLKVILSRLPHSSR